MAQDVQSALIKYLAGHRYISSTESYLENELEGLKEEAQQHHPLDYEALAK